MILGIETSCDDSSAAVYDGQRLLSNVISTQLVHRKFGGVVPELASRSHVQLVLPVIRQALDQAGVSKSELKGIAVTYGPGLAGSLLIGLCVAKGLSLALDIPLVGVNHMEGHIWSNFLAHDDLRPPNMTLLVSGGHTQLVHVKDFGEYEILGSTRDDAAGEAFDKVGKLLDVGYPGGPVIEKIAREGNAKAIRFPRAFLDEGSLDFSFSGLKTAVLNYVQKEGIEQVQSQLPDICASFQSAVVDVLVTKTIMAAEARDVQQICIAGGVAANQYLQQTMTSRAGKKGFKVSWPPLALCSDNAGMIAAPGFFYLKNGKTSPQSLAPNPGLSL